LLHRTPDEHFKHPEPILNAGKSSIHLCFERLDLSPQQLPCALDAVIMAALEITQPLLKDAPRIL
jgi:hypothetical protein